MATSRNLTGIASDPGTMVDPSVAGRASDYVVGSYDKYGMRKKAGQAVGGQSEAQRVRKLLVTSMSTRGGQLLPGFVMTEHGPVKVTTEPIAEPIFTAPSPITEPKSKRKKKGAQFTPVLPIQPIIPIQPIQSVQPVIEPRKTTFRVVFNIESGTINSSTDAILEDESSIILVYRDEDQVSYTPQKGSILTLTLPDKRQVMVMYLGIKCQWYNTTQQLLVFMKYKEE